MKLCSVEGCGERMLCKGVCKRHYERKRYRENSWVRENLKQYYQRPDVLKRIKRQRRRRWLRLTPLQRKERREHRRQQYKDNPEVRKYMAEYSRRPEVYARKQQADHQRWLNPQEQLKRRNRRRKRYQQDPVFHKKILEQSKKYRMSFKGQKRRRERDNSPETRASRRKRDRKYNRGKYKNNVGFKLAVLARTRVNIALRSYINGVKVISGIKDLGCTIKEFKEWIEGQFVPGMSWNNWGKKTGNWSIDHIVPFCKANMCNKKEASKIIHYGNQRPIWHIDNLIKGGR